MSASFDARQTLEDILENGVAAELRTYYSAKALCVRIGKRADAINASNFGQIFGQIQNQFVITLLLAVSKVFDKSQQSRSIQEAVRLLSKHAPSLPLENPLVLAGALGADERDPIKLIQEFASCAERKISDPSLSSILEDVRAQRDKRYAHNDKKVEPGTLASPTWGQTDRLAAIAISFLDVVSFAAFSRRYIMQELGRDDAVNLLENDAEGNVRALDRLLDRAGVPAGPS
jgi:AbiU2